MTKTTRCSVLAASAILSCCASGCSTSLSNNRALFNGSDKAGYVEGRSDEIKNLYWAQRNLGAKDADPRLKYKLTEIVVPAHYDSDGELIEAHREVIEMVQYFFAIKSIIKILISWYSPISLTSIYLHDTATKFMKRWFVLAFWIGLALPAGATIPVIDYSNLEQQIQNEYSNLTQYLSTVSNTLKSAQQLEQQVAQLGNYLNINNLPGVGTIGQIVGDGMSLYRQGTGIYGQIQGLTNPGQFTGQFQALLSRYGNYQNLLNSVTTYGPVSNQYTIPMTTATAQAVNGYQNALGTLNNQRNQLEQQLASTVSQLQGASTQAEVEKLNGEIAALSGQLNSVNEQIQQAAETSAQMAQQNQAAADAVQQAQDAIEGSDLAQGASGYANLLKFNSQPGD